MFIVSGKNELQRGALTTGSGARLPNCRIRGRQLGYKQKSNGLGDLTLEAVYGSAKRLIIKGSDGERLFLYARFEY